MKRDLDLIRLLLLQQEGVETVDLGGFTEDQVIYNSYLMIKHGLVEGNYVEHGAGFDIVEFGNPTWSGHDFLDTARNNTAWQKMKEAALSQGAALTIEIAKAWLIQYSKKALGLPE